jgi:hypothetical protein
MKINFNQILGEVKYREQDNTTPTSLRRIAKPGFVRGLSGNWLSYLDDKKSSHTGKTCGI